MTFNRLLLTALSSTLLCTPFLATAAPGDGIALGESTLVPYLQLGIGYDSNIGLRGRALGDDGAVISDARSDTYYTGKIGLKLSRASEIYSHYADAYLRTKRYSDEGGLDKEAYGLRLGLTLSDQANTTRLNLGGSLERVTDISDYSTADPQELVPVSDGLNDDVSNRLERDIYHARANLHRNLTDKSYGEVGYSHRGIAYSEERYFDTDHNAANVAVGHQVSDKSSVFVRGSYALEDNDSYDDAATTTGVQLGFRSNNGSTLSYNVGVGYETFDRSDTVDKNSEAYLARVESGASSRDLEDSSPKFNAGANWRVTDKLTATLSGSTGYVSSSFSRNNGSRMVLGQVGLNHRTTESLTLGLAVSLRENDFLDPVVMGDGEMIDESRETATVRATASYARRWYSLFASASYEDSSSEIQGESYDRTSVNGGIRLHY